MSCGVCNRGSRGSYPVRSVAPIRRTVVKPATLRPAQAYAPRSAAKSCPSTTCPRPTTYGAVASSCGGTNTCGRTAPVPCSASSTYGAASSCGTVAPSCGRVSTSSTYGTVVAPSNRTVPSCGGTTYGTVASSCNTTVAPIPADDDTIEGQDNGNCNVPSRGYPGESPCNDPDTGGKHPNSGCSCTDTSSFVPRKAVTFRMCPGSKKRGCFSCPSSGGCPEDQPCEVRCSGDEDLVWPPNNFFSVGDTMNLTHMFVPGDFQTLNEALCVLNPNQAGYAIHLKPGIHCVGSSHNSQTREVNIIGDERSVVGVGYIHMAGQWEKASLFDTQYDSDNGGLAPWCVSVTGNRITVTGCKDPVFDSLSCGDILVFHHRSGCLTEHRVCSGHGNQVFVREDVCLEGDCVVQGEGFFIKPNVTLATECPTQIVVQQRLTYQGIFFDTAPYFVTGSSAGYTSTKHSVVAGSYYHVGTAAWHHPNVTTGQMFWPEGSGGTAFYQSFLGSCANVQFGGSGTVAMSYAIHSGNTVALVARNNSHVSSIHSDFIGNTVGASISSGSRHEIRGSRYIRNGAAIRAQQSATVSAQPVLDLDPETIRPEFTCNDTALHINYNTHTVVNQIAFSGNRQDISLDGISLHPATVTQSGKYGPRNSTFIYQQILSPNGTAVYAGGNTLVDQGEYQY